MSRIGTVVSGFIKADDGMDMGSKRTPNGGGASKQISSPNRGVSRIDSATLQLYNIALTSVSKSDLVSRQWSEEDQACRWLHSQHHLHPPGLLHLITEAIQARIGIRHLH